MLEAQIPWRADVDRELDILNFLQRTKERYMGCMEEAPATTRQMSIMLITIDDGAATFSALTRVRPT